MAQEQKEKGTQQGEHAAKLAHADAAHREAYDYWGYLFKPDKCGTPLLDRLLRGIATTIVSGSTSCVLRPLADLHRARSSSPTTHPTSRPRSLPHTIAMLVATTTCSLPTRLPLPSHSYTSLSAPSIVYSQHRAMTATPVPRFPRSNRRAL